MKGYLILTAILLASCGGSENDSRSVGKSAQDQAAPSEDAEPDIAGATSTPILNSNAELPPAPINASIAIYGATIAEIFWEYPAGTEQIAGTQVYRDNLLLDVVSGTSYNDSAREEGKAHEYSLLALSANGDRSAVTDIGNTERQLIKGGKSLGKQIAVSGNSLMVAADRESGPASKGGAIDYYTRKSKTQPWTFAQRITLDGQSEFGSALALDGDTMVAGAEGEIRDGIFLEYFYTIFTRDAFGIWNPVQTIGTGDENVDTRHNNVAIQGNTMLLASMASADVYRKAANNTWNYEATLTPLNSTYNGLAVAIDSDTAIVGTPFMFNDNKRTGGATLFTRAQSGTWSNPQLLPADSASQSNRADVGASVSVSGDTIAVGAHANQSRVLIYTRDADGTWFASQTIEASDGVGGITGASVVTLHKDVLLVGLPFEDGLDWGSGSAVVYAKQDDGKWHEITRLNASDGGDIYQFGHTVALQENQAVIRGVSNVDLLTGPTYFFDLEFE